MSWLCAVGPVAPQAPGWTPPVLISAENGTVTVQAGENRPSFPSPTLISAGNGTVTVQSG